MRGLLQSSIVRGLARPLLSCAGVATLVCIYEDSLRVGGWGWEWEAVSVGGCHVGEWEGMRVGLQRPPRPAPPQEGLLPPWLPTLLMPTDPFNLTSFALSLLLVFRTNTSYDRWLEVVEHWGGM